MNLTAQIKATGHCFRSPRPKKKGKGIPAMSEKRKVEIRVYTQLRKKFLKQNPMCEAGAFGCTKRATQIHHTKKRGKNYLNVETWMPTCAHCHRWIEDHKDQARELGWLAY